MNKNNFELAETTEEIRKFVGRKTSAKAAYLENMLHIEEPRNRLLRVTCNILMSVII